MVMITEPPTWTNETTLGSTLFIKDKCQIHDNAHGSDCSEIRQPLNNIGQCPKLTLQQADREAGRRDLGKQADPTPIVDTLRDFTWQTKAIMRFCLNVREFIDQPLPQRQAISIHIRSRYPLDASSILHSLKLLAELLFPTRRPFTQI